ncbi:hypothetical protein C8E86_8367 [Catellatospora citrea]|nr:hypothetical protein C8E86_8367 [Catellatospora citrea]
MSADGECLGDVPLGQVQHPLAGRGSRCRRSAVGPRSATAPVRTGKLQPMRVEVDRSQPRIRVAEAQVQEGVLPSTSKYVRPSMSIRTGSPSGVTSTWSGPSSPWTRPYVSRAGIGPRRWRTCAAIRSWAWAIRSSRPAASWRWLSARSTMTSSARRGRIAVAAAAPPDGGVHPAQGVAERGERRGRRGGVLSHQPFEGDRSGVLGERDVVDVAVAVEHEQPRHPDVGRGEGRVAGGEQFGAGRVERSSGTVGEGGQ